MLRRQHLTDDTKGTAITPLIRDVCGLHGTNATTPYLMLFERMTSFKKEDLKRILMDERSAARLRTVRNTVYVLTKDMMPAAFSAVKSRMLPNSRNFMKYTGFSLDDYHHYAEKILALFDDDVGMTTAEIRRALDLDIKVSSLVNLMCDEAHLIRTPPRRGWRSNAHVYYRFDDFMSDVDLHALDEDTAAATLIGRYIAAFGPVSRTDICWWTGMAARRVDAALAALGGACESCTVDDLDGEFFITRDAAFSVQPSKTTLNLLPSLDSYLMGYKERQRLLDDDQYSSVFDRSGNAVPCILRDGRVIGVWDVNEAERCVKLHFLGTVSEAHKKAIYAQAKRTGQFIMDGAPVTVKHCPEMPSLTERRAGIVMTPLKGL